GYGSGPAASSSAPAATAASSGARTRTPSSSSPSSRAPSSSTPSSSTPSPSVATNPNAPDAAFDLAAQNPTQGASAAAGSQGVTALQFTVTAGADDLTLQFIELGAIAAGGLDPSRDVTDVQIVDANGNVLLDGTFVAATQPLASGLAVTSVTSTPVVPSAGFVAAGTSATFTVRLSFSATAPSGGMIQVVFDSSSCLAVNDNSLLNTGPVPLSPGPTLQGPQASPAYFEQVSASGPGSSGSGSIGGGPITWTQSNAG